MVYKLLMALLEVNKSFINALSINYKLFIRGKAFDYWKMFQRVWAK